jgi:hypothetical protein
MKACEAAAAAEAVGAGVFVDEWGYTELTVSNDILGDARSMIAAHTMRTVELDVTRRLEKIVDITRR